jgi:spermidine/putrescine transport system ATP-binding protein
MEKVIIKLEDFSKSYGDKQIIKNLNLEVYEGEFLTLLGSSGCGKTTILRSISGLDYPTSGKIYLDGVDVTDLEPQKREVNTIFQNYALFPLMTVEENIAFGLKMKKVPKEEIEKRVKKMIELVHLEGYEKRKPKELSGGEQQRVSIVRGLINNPKVLLLDEPLSALDLKLRKKMQVELKHLQKKLGITFIYVTHDQDEALSMSDRIVILNKGKIEQVGTPVEIYDYPNSLFVANFIGETNVFKGVVKEKKEGKIKIFTKEEFEIETIYDDFELEQKINLVIRPEDMRLSKTEKKVNCLEGVIQDLIYDGAFTKVLVKIDNKIVNTIITGTNRHYNRGDNVYVWWKMEDVTILGSEQNEKE